MTHVTIAMNRSRLPLSSFLAGVILVTATAGAQDKRTPAKTHIPRLERILNENILPFWFSKSLDRANGGYTINFGPKGEPKGPGTKMIVTQSRMLWLFSRMARAGIQTKEALDAADLGYRFLTEKMWDRKNGGFYWEVDAAGTTKLSPKKHMYGQAFGLYAVSEYCRATGKKEALDFATGIFNLIESKSHDGTYGGYNESFNEDWSAVPAGDDNYMGGGLAGLKLMNTHLHLLEAVATFYRASRLPLARERLLELISIETNAVVRKSLGACTDKYERDWTPRLDRDYARVSYGHDIENVWLVIDACEAAGISNYPLLDLYRTLWDYSLKYGYDSAAGGFFSGGAFDRPADDRTKVWWVEAEALESALYMYRLTKETKYLSIFEQTLGFIEKHQVDWENGEWHRDILSDGTRRGDKADAWKAGYHDGRSMIECIEILKGLP
ncbi:MAG TPA: AGE family epimerase/isomerase [Blastocatellia bacterium]|nr:AGE family epimerase/isomerase [Blastocatellia bacterium]